MIMRIISISYLNVNNWILLFFVFINLNLNLLKSLFVSWFEKSKFGLIVTQHTLNTDTLSIILNVCGYSIGLQ